MTTLEKRKVVLTLDPQFTDKDDAFFGSPDPDELGVEAIHIPTDTWLDMGNPETITVTIEIGDTLNESDA